VMLITFEKRFLVRDQITPRQLLKIILWICLKIFKLTEREVQIHLLLETSAVFCAISECTNAE
jgi:hypothetical protein